MRKSSFAAVFLCQAALVICLAAVSFLFFSQYLQLQQVVLFNILLLMLVLTLIWLLQNSANSPLKTFLDWECENLPLFKKLRYPLLSCLGAAAFYSEMEEIIDGDGGEVCENNKLMREQLKSLVRGLPEPCVLMDSKGKVLSANKAFSDLSGSRDVDGQYLCEVIKSDSHLSSILDNLISGQTDLPGELKVEVEGHDYLCKITRIDISLDYFIMFKNISDKVELARTKRELITNISHELKTPLTSIKGYVETLQEEEQSPVKLQYLEIINKQADRMTNIVSDLLVLSELENLDIHEFGEVDINEIIQEAAHAFDKRLKEKNIPFSFMPYSSKNIVCGDKFKLEEVFVNLIDNAIRYTDSGSISVTTSKMKDSIEIRVKDTGIGIPQKHIARIFERFYVVDKSRSKATGGTGLGLSIVKHIIMLHKGDIEVISSPGKGTEVRIVLPSPLS